MSCWIKQILFLKGAGLSLEAGFIIKYQILLLFLFSTLDFSDYDFLDQFLYIISSSSISHAELNPMAQNKKQGESW